MLHCFLLKKKHSYQKKKWTVVVGKLEFNTDVNVTDKVSMSDKKVMKPQGFR